MDKRMIVLMLLGFYSNAVNCAESLDSICQQVANGSTGQFQNEIPPSNLEQLRRLCDITQWAEWESIINHVESIDLQSNDDNAFLQRSRRSISFFHFHRNKSSSVVSSSQSTTGKPRFGIFDRHSPTQSYPAATTKSSVVVTPQPRIRDKVREFFGRSTASPSESTTTKKHRFGIFHHHSPANNQLIVATNSPVLVTQKPRVRDRVREFFGRSTAASSAPATTKKHRFSIFHRDPSPNSELEAITNSSVSVTAKPRIRDRVREFFGRSTASPSESVTTKKHRFSIFHRHSPASNYPAAIRNSSVVVTPKPRVRDRVRGFFQRSTASPSVSAVSAQQSNKTRHKLIEAGKKYLPVAIRYAKKYRENRKPKQMAVFYCHLEEADTLLITGSVDEEGYGECMVSEEVFPCPVEIQCRMSEADSCCRDDYGIPFCCRHSSTTVREQTSGRATAIPAVTVVVLVSLIAHGILITWL